jgi:hypothetical protein
VDLASSVHGRVKQSRRSVDLILSRLKFLVEVRSFKKGYEIKS